MFQFGLHRCIPQTADCYVKCNGKKILQRKSTTTDARKAEKLLLPSNNIEHSAILFLKQVKGASAFAIGLQLEYCWVLHSVAIMIDTESE